MSLIIKALNFNNNNLISALPDNNVFEDLYPVQGWEINISKDGNTNISFRSPANLTDDVKLCKGNWIELYSIRNMLVPLARLQLNSIKKIQNNKSSDCCFYEVEGNSYPFSLSENGYILKLKEGQITYSDLSNKVIKQLNNQSQNIFSIDNRFISKTNEYFQNFQIKNYAEEYFKYISDLSIVNYFDNYLRLHQHNINEHSQYIYTLIAGIIGDTYSITDITGIRPDLPIDIVLKGSPDSVILSNLTVNTDNQGIYYMDNNTIRLSNTCSYQSNLYIRQAIPTFIEIDLEKDLDNTIVSAPSSTAPVSQYIFTGDNIRLDDIIKDEFKQSDNKNSNNSTNIENTSILYKPQIFTLSKKINEPRYIAEDLDSQTANFENASLMNADYFDNGRLWINSLSGENELTHYRNYNLTLNTLTGATAGASISIHKTTGHCSLLGLRQGSNDNINNYLAGFRIANQKLQYILNGQAFDTDFTLIPTIDSNILNINDNSIIVNSSVGYTIGQDMLILDVNDNVVGIAENLISISSNTLLFENIEVGSNYYKLKQVAEYLVKYVISGDNIVFFAKKGSDTFFTEIKRGGIAIPDETFLQVYANNNHNISFDFIDIVDNFDLRAYRLSPNSTGNCGSNTNIVNNIVNYVYDIGYGELASRLQSEIQIELNNDKYEIKFPTLDNDDVFYENTYLLLNILANNILELNNTFGLEINNRILVDGNIAYITAINNNIITIDRNILNLSIDTLVLKTNIHLANNEILVVEYNPVEKIIISLCNDCDCSGNGANGSLIKNISLDKTMTYSEFVEYANNQVKMYCGNTYEGSIKRIIEYDNSDKNCYYSWWDSVYAGQLVKFKSTDSNLNGIYAIVYATKLTEINEYMYEIEISFSSTAEDDIVNTLNGKPLSRVVKLINDNIPDEDVLCVKKEQINLSNIPNPPDNRANMVYKSGMHKSWISGYSNNRYECVPSQIFETGKLIRLAGSFKSRANFNTWSLFILFDDATGLFDDGLTLFDDGPYI